MRHKKLVREEELAQLAKVARKRARLFKAEVARQLGVTRGTIHQAEEYPDMSRIRMIEKCLAAKISGPFYHIDTGKMTRRTL
jgi:DNA-binding XRE family transcriptional regulator